MPTLTRSLCLCGGIKTGGICERCGPTRKRSRTAKGGEYGGAWKRTSNRNRTLIPWCVNCWHEERITVAVEGKPLQSHHIVPVLVAPHLRDDQDNLLTTCKDCHDLFDDLYLRDRTAYDRLMVALTRVREELRPKL